MSILVSKRLFDAKEAAEYLSISRAKLYQWCDNNRIPSVRIDSRRLFDVLELDAFVDLLKRSQNPSSDSVKPNLTK